MNDSRCLIISCSLKRGWDGGRNHGAISDIIVSTQMCLQQLYSHFLTTFTQALHIPVFHFNQYVNRKCA